MHWRRIRTGSLKHLDIVWAAWGFTLSYCAAALKCKHSSKSKNTMANKKTQWQNRKHNSKAQNATSNYMLTLSSHRKGRYLWKTRIFIDSTNTLSVTLTHMWLLPPKAVPVLSLEPAFPVLTDSELALSQEKCFQSGSISLLSQKEWSSHVRG